MLSGITPLSSNNSNNTFPNESVLYVSLERFWPIPTNNIHFDSSSIFDSFVYIGHIHTENSQKGFTDILM